MSLRPKGLELALDRQHRGSHSHCGGAAVFHFSGSEAFQEMRTRDQILTDTLIVWEIPRVFGAMSQKLWMKTHIHMRNTHLFIQMNKSQYPSPDPPPWLFVFS